MTGSVRPLNGTRNIGLDTIVAAGAREASARLLPTLGVFYLRCGGGAAAMASMLVGGTTLLVLIIGGSKLPGDLESAVSALPLSLTVYLVVGALEVRPGKRDRIRA